MSVFSAAQLAYLGERRLARIATVGADGTPHVTPVGMLSHNPVHDSIDVTGREFASSKKYHDVARAAQAAIVIDDLAQCHSVSGGMGLGVWFDDFAGMFFGGGGAVCASAWK